MREQREFEKIADSGIDAIARLGDDWRAAVVEAWMAVSIKRAKPQTPMSQIIARLDEFKAQELKDAWSDVVGQSPPQATEPAPSESPPRTDESSSESSETVRVPTIPPGTGGPGSEPSVSDPLRSVS